MKAVDDVFTLFTENSKPLNMSTARPVVLISRLHCNSATHRQFCDNCFSHIKVQYKSETTGGAADIPRVSPLIAKHPHRAFI